MCSARSTTKSSALARRLPSGCAQKAVACVASLVKRRMAAAGALASELLKLNASFKNSVNRPWFASRRQTSHQCTLAHTARARCKPSQEQRPRKWKHTARFSSDAQAGKACYCPSLCHINALCKSTVDWRRRAATDHFASQAQSRKAACVSRSRISAGYGRQPHYTPAGDDAAPAGAEAGADDAADAGADAGAGLADGAEAGDAAGAGSAFGGASASACASRSLS